MLNAGATPPVGSFQEQTWEMFSTNWNVDVRHVFNFTREVLTAPLEPGSVVISLSSGAALAGSPLSGGYAGAKATIKLISSYAGLEAQRLGADIRFVSVLPALTPATDLGKIYTERYAAMAGMSEAQFLEVRFGGTLSAEQVGESIATWPWTTPIRTRRIFWARRGSTQSNESTAQRLRLVTNLRQGL